MLKWLLYIKKNYLRLTIISIDVKTAEGKYEVKFRKGSYKYEYDVLAPTGQIISFEKELIRR